MVVTRVTITESGNYELQGWKRMSEATPVVSEEHSAIEEGRAIVECEQNGNNWRLGELAAELHESGQTDQQISDSWDCSQQRVSACRRVFVKFTPMGVKPDWAWRWFREMLNWDDAEQMVIWAAETQANWPETQAYRRLMLGEDIRQPAVAPTIQAPEPFEPIAVPEETSENTEETADPEPIRRESVVQKITETPDLMKTVRESVAALKAAVAHIEDADRAKLAKSLHKLAEEIYPSTGARFVAPDVDDVAVYCAERGNRVDPEAFWAFYDANGWKQANGNKLKRWQSAVITWEKGEYGQSTSKNTGIESSLEALARAGNR